MNKKWKILIIDDDEDIRQSFQALLREFGHTVAVAPNGKVGLKELTHENYDIIILDIFMPEKDGIETIQEIKQQFPQTKIIATSGEEWRGFLLKTMKSLGADYILEKPIISEQLLDIINVF